MPYSCLNTIIRFCLMSLPNQIIFLFRQNKFWNHLHSQLKQSKVKDFEATIIYQHIFP